MRKEPKTTKNNQADMKKNQIEFLTPTGRKIIYQANMNPTMANGSIGNIKQNGI